MTVLWRFKFVRIKNVNSKPHLIIYTCIHDVHACNLLHLHSLNHIRRPIWMKFTLVKTVTLYTAMRLVICDLSTYFSVCKF